MMIQVAIGGFRPMMVSRMGIINRLHTNTKGNRFAHRAMPRLQRMTPGFERPLGDQLRRYRTAALSRDSPVVIGSIRDNGKDLAGTAIDKVLDPVIQIE